MKLIGFSLIMLSLLIVPLSSKAGGDLRIEPESPIAGQPVRLYYYGCEPPYPHVESGELFYTERSDNLVQFVGFFTFSLPLCPTLWEQYYDLGTFEAGEYELEVYLFLALEILPIDLDIRTPNEIIEFGVTEPEQIPLLGTPGLIFMLLSMVGTAFIYKRRFKV